MYNLAGALKEDMLRKGIDVDLSCAILEDYNAGLYDDVKQVRAKGVPAIDGRTVIDVREARRKSGVLYSTDEKTARDTLSSLGVDFPGSVEIHRSGRGTSVAAFGADALLEIGRNLLAKTAYGVLNGGSATSYADGKKNLALGRDVFEVLSPAFHEIAPLCKDAPKGLTPAYINPDGSPGASFLELKMRARLLLASGARARDSRGDGGTAQPASASSREFLPLFQMTSTSNNEVLAAAYERLSRSPFIAPLSERANILPASWHTGVQPMIAAYTHSSEGRPKRIFDRAYGLSNSALPLPGGHGQSFRVLTSVLQELFAAGIRYACLGNVDNIGYTPDPIELAILAISGQPAAFEFAARTPMDVKGGILVETEEGKLTVADIGPAIDFEEVVALEQKGYSILFNCASGIFDLAYLVPRIEEIARKLPVRFTDQDKDMGRYSQAEQVTWEVTGILPSFIAFAVDKHDRFLAAKLLVDTLLTSGIGIDDPRLPESVKITAAHLHEGLRRALRRVYGLELAKGRWVPGKPTF